MTAGGRPPRRDSSPARRGERGGERQERLPIPQADRPKAPPGESAESPLSIDDLAATIKVVVAGSFPVLWVEGEVTQFTQHRNGHWYFSLKGQAASIRCVVWASTARWLPAAPDEGMKVIVCGQVDVYAGRSELQFIVSRLTAAGDGLFRKAFEETRRRLEADGLLDQARKRPLPFFPRCVAVITSPDGAALHDVTSVIRRRNPLVEVVLVPAAVQGQDAVMSLGRALSRLVRWGGADVVIIGRGGGSREDLWAFNDERLSRKLASCPVPVITAVGHEIDTTICDLVADFRAATPSAAAELAVPNLQDVTALVERLRRRLREGLSARAGASRRQLEHCSRRLTLAAGRVVERRRLRVSAAAGKLNALSPLAVLSRGFAIATDVRGLVVSSIASVSPGDELEIRLRDGRLTTTVRRAEGEPP
ncbi:MAG: exodeoxyribonuclease VII large subunit [Gemmatimonadota bacterium]